MANIIGSINLMNDIEISSDAPLTEALMTKIGANINALIGLLGNVVAFTSSGTFVVPENISRMYMQVVGGGGGGGSGSKQVRVIGDLARGGGGGGGVSPVFALIQTIPLETLGITVGGGGVGGATTTVNGSTGNNGAGGGESSVVSVTRGGQLLIRCGGGAPGIGGNSALASNRSAQGWTAYRPNVYGGSGSYPSYTVPNVAENGENSSFANGGAAPPNTPGPEVGGGGGGGAGFLGGGGAGGNGASPSPFAVSLPGGNGFGYGAGGGGGGSGFGDAPFSNGAPGGNGTPGIVILAW
jgi:hypothetical protein